jgi:hypothetical protein
MVQTAEEAEHITDSSECYDADELITPDQDALVDSMCDNFEANENAPAELL